MVNEESVLYVHWVTRPEISSETNTETFFELKVLNESKFSMPWVRSAFGNVSKELLKMKNICPILNLMKFLLKIIWPSFKIDEILGVAQDWGK